MSQDASHYFRAEPTDSGWRVVDASGTAILECRDGPSAQHYVELLNRAYRAGYRAGYRASRREAEGKQS